MSGAADHRNQGELPNLMKTQEGGETSYAETGSIYWLEMIGTGYQSLYRDCIECRAVGVYQGKR